MMMNFESITLRIGRLVHSRAFFTLRYLLRNESVITNVDYIAEYYHTARDLHMHITARCLYGNIYSILRIS